MLEQPALNVWEVVPLSIITSLNEEKDEKEKGRGRKRSKRLCRSVRQTP